MTLPLQKAVYRNEVRPHNPATSAFPDAVLTCLFRRGCLFVHALSKLHRNQTEITGGDQRAANRGL